MREVTRWVNSEEEDEVRAALGASDGEVAGADDAEGSRAALEVLESVWAAEDRLRSSLLATVAGAIDAYGDSRVLECSQSAEITELFFTYSALVVLRPRQGLGDRGADPISSPPTSRKDGR